MVVDGYLMALNEQGVDNVNNYHIAMSYIETVEYEVDFMYD
jgi:hypothetical protein